ncbi:EAL domain-containing protein [Lysobacter niastensis]|uniref:EAL domain-containing protein n=1 Tax=Lysobacter niastensis TaxID=380629 RepID=A0ABS0B254_9GAMM|nr:EAL domain-containing protein [Lysobacter niastensis]MBF6022403.1 EAL domain-containing protein [Lysobacter niastensis]
MRPSVPALSVGLLGLILIAAGIGPPAHAATRDFYFTRLGSDRGLTQNTVTALAQDRQGFVWVGTQGGLHRYDGKRYVAFRHDPRDPGTLPDSFVTALAVEGREALWIGTYSEYVARLDLGTGKIRRYQITDGEHANRQVMALLPARGSLWVGTVAGLERLDAASGRRTLVVRLNSQTTREAPWQNLLATRDGSVWFASNAGLYRIAVSGAVDRVGPAEPAGSLGQDHRGQLWIGRHDGLYRLHSDGRTLIRTWPTERDAGIHDVRSIAEAPDGRLWLGIPGEGLLRYDPVSGRSEAVREEAGVDATLPDESVSSLLVDRGGMLWVGGGFRGVSITDPRGSRFRYVFDLDSGRSRNAAADDSVRAAIQDDEGALWVGTDNGRLLHYRLDEDRFDDDSAALPMLPQHRAVGFVPAGDGELWVATTRGLVRLNTHSRHTRPLDLGEYSNASLRTISKDRDGSLWLGTTNLGALRYDPRSGRVVRYAYREGQPSGLSHPTVHAIAQDRRGRIWMGTSDGLDLLDPATGMLRHFRHRSDAADSLAGNRVRAVHIASDGAIWVGTHAGLSRVIEVPGEPIHFAHPLSEALRGRPVPVVFSIAEAPSGRLWLGTDAGILRFDTDNDQARAYGLADGLQDLEFNGGAVAYLSDGRVLLGGVRGINLFDPRRMADSRYTPPVRLLSARVGADDSLDGGVLWDPARLDVPDGADLLRLRIGALDFAPAANIRYRYRMDGFDQGWVDNGMQQDISYTGLPPGRYLFRAQATNRDGVWNPQELQIPVFVAPPLWRHPLALTAAALMLLALGATLSWRWHQRRERERGYFDQIREREERLKLALWASGEQFWDYDLARGELHRMRVHEEGGLAPDIGVQTYIEEEHEIHPDDLPRVRELLRQHLRGDSALFLSEHRVRNASGSWSWVRARGRVVDRGDNGRALRVAGTARDVTASRSAERERRISSEVLRSMAEAVAVVDRDFMFVSVNPAFTRMTGYSDAEVIGRSSSLIDSMQHDPEFYRHMRSELERTGRWSGEIWQQRKDGNEFLCWLQGSAVQDASGQRSHYVAVLTDITDQKRAEQELRYLANYDTLTSLPNRTLLSERLSRAIVRARRQGTHIAVLFLDLDRFKDINDSLGHAAGDRILRATAARLLNAVGNEHTVARLGGDEFTVVLENLKSPDEAERIARDLLQAFEDPLEIDERQDVSISPSIGISLYPEHAQVPTDLLKHADTAMYQAKAAGRRTYMRYNEVMDVEIRRRATISAALRKVLDRGELRLVFQPKLSLATSQITGVEALLRWNSPEHGEISPAQFIPLAEESGLILDIGEWALREACSTLKRWRHNGLDQLTMAVNVSALQLLRGSLPRTVARTLIESGVPAEQLQLELTESVIMANAEQTSATLQALRSIGVGLAIDDFGTGYSSLAYLKRLPINTLKIDKEFIGDLTHDPEDEAITSTVITMARSLGLTVVAEGVETVDQMRFLREHGCDEIQGYWLARPLEAQHCFAFIRTWTPSALSTVGAVP